MPIKLLLKFQAGKKIPASSLKPKTVHGIFFSLLPKDIGEIFHVPSVKPFSLFYPAYFKSPNKNQISFTIEMNILNNKLFPKISQLLFRKTLLEKEFVANVDEVKLRLTTVKAKDVTTFESLMAKAKPLKELIFDFVTPTTFKKGRYDYVLPEPYLVFKSLLNKWNAFSPIKISDKKLLSFVKKNILISGCWIKTKKTELMSRAKITGFSGRVFFYVANFDEEKLKILNALSRFAEFSGVGRKTTMGFGKVKLAQKREGDEQDF